MSMLTWQWAMILLCGVLFVICFAAVIVNEGRRAKNSYAKFDARVGRDVWRDRSGITKL